MKFASLKNINLEQVILEVKSFNWKNKLEKWKKKTDNLIDQNWIHNLKKYSFFSLNLIDLNYGNGRECPKILFYLFIGFVILCFFWKKWKKLKKIEKK